jgi:hypothetical protein
MLKTRALALLAASLLGACANPLLPGASRAEAEARYGAPGRVVPLPGGGTRLQYSRQPLGRNAFMVDLDAAGKVTSAREVLNPAGFARVVPGQWTRADAEREFGRPASVDRVASWTGDILTYRWLDGTQPMYFWIYLDPQNVVRKAAQGMEFLSLRDAV